MIVRLADGGKVDFCKGELPYTCSYDLVCPIPDTKKHRLEIKEIIKDNDNEIAMDAYQAF